VSLLALFNYLEVVVEYRRNHRHHVRFDNTSSDGLRPSHTNVHYTLKGQVPLPHLHHVLAPALLEYAYQSLNAAIDGEDVSNATGGCGEICEIVERVDEREGRGAIERTAVVEGGGDADRRLVCVRDAKVDFAHVCVVSSERRRGRRAAGS
jgi:hypothetical protein